MKRMIILVFLLNYLFSKKYLVELKDKDGHKESDEIDEEEVNLKVKQETIIPKQGTIIPRPHRP